jgi:glycogen operon protein
MLLAGDEFGRTQRGNNNAYCQDNDVSWLNWRLAEGEEGQALAAFDRRMTALRHRIRAALRAVPAWQDEPAPTCSTSPGSELGEPMSREAWNNRRGRDAGSAPRRAATDDGLDRDPHAASSMRRRRNALSAAAAACPTRPAVGQCAPQEPERDLGARTTSVKARQRLVLHEAQAARS